MKLQIILLLALASISLDAMQGPKHAVNFFTRKIAERQAYLTLVRELKEANLVIRESYKADPECKPDKFIVNLLTVHKKLKRNNLRGTNAYTTTHIPYESVCPPTLTLDQGWRGARELTTTEMLLQQQRELEHIERFLAPEIDKLKVFQELAKSMNK